MRTITFTLDPKSISRAIREVKDYAQEVEEKTKRLREMVAERIAWSASNGFRTAITGDIVGMLFEGKVYKTEPPPNDVTVTVTHNGDVSIVFAEGQQAVFIEYGAGVYNNGAAGTSPHPWGAQFGYFIGSYGKGHGKRKVWGYVDDARGVVLTHGTPAAMPLFRGMTEAINVIDDLAREVFG